MTPDRELKISCPCYGCDSYKLYDPNKCRDLDNCVCRLTENCPHDHACDVFVAACSTSAAQINWSLSQGPIEVQLDLERFAQDIRDYVIITRYAGVFTELNRELHDGILDGITTSVDLKDHVIKRVGVDTKDLNVTVVRLSDDYGFGYYATYMGVPLTNLL